MRSGARMGVPAGHGQSTVTAGSREIRFGRLRRCVGHLFRARRNKAQGRPAPEPPLCVCAARARSDVWGEGSSLLKKRVRGWVSEGVDYPTLGRVVAVAGQPAWVGNLAGVGAAEQGWRV